MTRDVEILHPDAIYPALEKPATELERLVVEALGDDNLTHPKLLTLVGDLRREARHRRLIP